MLSGDHTAQATLEKEIQNLEDQLQDQFAIRQMLEKTLNQKRYVCDAQSTNPIPKQAEELIKEIAVLELEVAYLEKYVLSLNRKTFVQQVSKDKDCASAAFKHGENFTSDRSCPIFPRHPIGSPLKERQIFRAPLSQPDSGVHRSQFCLSHRSSSHSKRLCPPVKPLAEYDEAYHSLPLSMLERAEHSRSNTSLGEYLLQSVSDHDWETPNWISEEMIKSITGIYCELAEPPLLTNHYLPDLFSPSLPGSDHFGFSSFNSNFYNPFCIDHSRELGGPQTDMVEVRWISRDSERLKNIEYMLRKYRSLVHRLRQVDLSKMKHEEKLAFWINVQNSLGMHAFLVHGISKIKLKRTASLLKAAYNVGGQAISLHQLRNFILQCKMLLPGQWLRLFFPSRQNSKIKDVPKAYAIDRPEHLLPFALCSGCFSDPAVRVYRPDKVFKELKAAREEYLQSNISFHKEKVLIPKLVQSYAKLSGLSPNNLLTIILCHNSVPYSSSQVRQSHQKRKATKSIEWIPHNFDFRYLLSNELA
ncbi:uncharacterized protein LOC116203144 isoform X2 [Punica granatum]|uniref:Uncharacterized protein LOC116203144 isoform X2 n=1 Tax=Punica granatum TaxID=22663 RepID=A0A6P8D2Q3_PUNGR|nr:uncharacterized protein LOC116203144 isoform X2 [Punica granatum]